MDFKSNVDLYKNLLDEYSVTSLSYIDGFEINVKRVSESGSAFGFSSLLTILLVLGFIVLIVRSIQAGGAQAMFLRRELQAEDTGDALRRRRRAHLSSIPRSRRQAGPASYAAALQEARQRSQSRA